MDQRPTNVKPKAFSFLLLQLYCRDHLYQLQSKFCPKKGRILEFLYETTWKLIHNYNYNTYVSPSLSNLYIKNYYWQFST